MKKDVLGLLCIVSPIIANASGSADYMADYYSGHYFKASKILQELVSQNDKEAMFYLGKMYVNGHGVAKLPEKGLELIKQSGIGGYESAQLYLAKYYLEHQARPKEFCQKSKEKIVIISKKKTKIKKEKEIVV